MTTVKDLILALQKFPMDAPVFIYSALGECDGAVDKVSYEGPIEKLTTNLSQLANDICSEAERYWNVKNTRHPVVFIQSVNNNHDFTID
jgi:hypothetical protein